MMKLFENNHILGGMSEVAHILADIRNLDAISQC